MRRFPIATRRFVSAQKRFAIAQVPFAIAEKGDSIAEKPFPKAKKGSAIATICGAIAVYRPAIAYLGRVKSRPLIWPYSGESAPKSDFTYFLTNAARSQSPLVS